MFFPPERSTWMTFVHIVLNPTWYEWSIPEPPTSNRSFLMKPAMLFHFGASKWWAWDLRKLSYLDKVYCIINGYMHTCPVQFTWQVHLEARKKIWPELSCESKTLGEWPRLDSSCHPKLRSTLSSEKRLSTTTTLAPKTTHPDPAPIHPTHPNQTSNQKTQPETFLPPWLLLPSLSVSAEVPPPLHDAPHRKRRSLTIGPNDWAQTVGSLQLPWMKVRLDDHSLKLT